ncbi:MAG: cytochrome c family protein [Sandarakinorhabdus sp.]|nr:cytochrome c family protein [Sandarakinorhabdus sp.]
MDSFEVNKIAGGVLAAAVVALAISIGTSAAFRPALPEKQSYIVEGVEVAATTAGPAEAEKPIAFYLASATAEKGEAVFKKCAACHNNEKGGAAGIGPNLYGIVGNVHDQMAGYAYSDALMAMKGKVWTWDELNHWLTSPKAYAAGTKMAFAGVSKPEDRASLLVYLNSKSDKPLPLPAAPAETAAADEAAPAADAAAPAADAAAPAEAAAK